MAASVVSELTGIGRCDRNEPIIVNTLFGITIYGPVDDRSLRHGVKRPLMDRLQAMRVFARVAELGSFARAAEALALSRARVSEAVAGLERALGARLLHRTTRRLALSDDGRAFYERAARILADVDEAEALVTRGRSQARGRLRVDMPMALARLHVVPALPRLLARHAGLELEVRLENRAIDLVAEGIDCAISYGPPADTELVARRIGTTHLVTCAAPSYLARHPAPRTPEALARHNAIAFLSLATGRPARLGAGARRRTADAPAGRQPGLQLDGGVRGGGPGRPRHHAGAVLAGPRRDCRAAAWCRCCSTGRPRARRCTSSTRPTASSRRASAPSSTSPPTSSPRPTPVEGHRRIRNPRGAPTAKPSTPPALSTGRQNRQTRDRGRASWAWPTP